MRQLYFMRRAIEEAELNEFEAQAKLHDKNIERPPQRLNIPKEDREEYDKAAEKMQEKLRARYNKNKFIKGLKENGKRQRTTDKD